MFDIEFNSVIDQEEGEEDASGTNEIQAQSYENIIVEDIESEIRKNNNKETESESTLLTSTGSTSQLPPPRPTVTSYSMFVLFSYYSMFVLFSYYSMFMECLFNIIERILFFVLIY
jgi:hypothetical protein